MRLVDADALLHELATSSYPQDVDINRAYRIFQNELAAAPTVDAVPVVRCRDCKYWRRDTDHTCKEHSLVSPMLADGFCSRGKRKDGDNGQTD